MQSFCVPFQTLSDRVSQPDRGSLSDSGLDGKWNLVRLQTLLHLMARAEDTNVLHRGGPEAAAYVREEAAALLSGGEKELSCLNYYTNETIRIPLDETKTAQENARKYFEKYNKQKRTFEALTELIQETKREIDHLESISASLDIALKEEDLTQIKMELTEYGFIKKHGPTTSPPTASTSMWERTITRMKS